LTLFEYVAIAYCLVISFAVARTASVIPYALAKDRRYWVHTTWVFANLGMSLLVFWNFWSFRDVDWTLGSLSLQLAIPTSVFVFASIVAPDEPAKILSWAEYFYSIRVKLFTCALVTSVLIFLTSTFLLEMPMTHPARLAQAAMFAMSLAGALSDRPRVHVALATLVLITFAFNGLRLFAAPGALVSGS
jgi:hypothetical protein